MKHTDISKLVKEIIDDYKDIDITYSTKFRNMTTDCFTNELVRENNTKYPFRNIVLSPLKLKVVTKGVDDNYALGINVPCCMLGDTLYVEKSLAYEEDTEYVRQLLVHEIGHFFSDAEHKDSEFINTINVYNEYYNDNVTVNPETDEVVSEVLERLPIFAKRDKRSLIDEEIPDKEYTTEMKEILAKDMESLLPESLQRIFSNVLRESSLKKISIEKLKKLVSGGLAKDDKFFRGVRSVAIMSCSSPTNTAIDGVYWTDLDSTDEEIKEKAQQVWDADSCSDWNYKSNKKFIQWLKDTHFRFRKVIGLYEGKEVSYVILNAPKDLIESKAREYCQLSYMYTDVVDNANTDEVSKAITYIETFQRDSADTNSEYVSIGLPYGISQDDSHVDIDTVEDNSEHSLYQTRIDNDKGFSVQYGAYGADKPEGEDWDRFSL